MSEEKKLMTGCRMLLFLLAGGCTGSMRYVNPEHEAAIPTSPVELSWRVSPPNTVLLNCTLEVADNPSMRGASKTPLSTREGAPNRMVQNADGVSLTRVALQPGTYYWDVLCDTESGVAITKDAEPSEPGRLIERPRIFHVGTRVQAAVAQNRPTATSATVVQKTSLPSVVRPSGRQPPLNQDVTIALVSARWDGRNDDSFAKEIESRLVEAGYAVQHAGPWTPGAEKAEPAFPDAPVYSFDGPAHGQILRPDRFMLVESHVIPLDVQVFDAADQGKVESSPGPYASGMRAVYARLLDAKNGRIVWSDRFYVPPAATPNSVLSELVQRRR